MKHKVVSLLTSLTLIFSMTVPTHAAHFYQLKRVDSWFEQTEFTKKSDNSKETKLSTSEIGNPIITKDGSYNYFPLFSLLEKEDTIVNDVYKDIEVKDNNKVGYLNKAAKFKVVRENGLCYDIVYTRKWYDIEVDPFDDGTSAHDALDSALWLDKPDSQKYRVKYLNELNLEYPYRIGYEHGSSLTHAINRWTATGGATVLHDH